jgi:DNA-binding transcriptional LysR family regulator
MIITLRQLEVFEAVATLQHVTEASERLFITQSAVSMAISELEKAIQGPLFERRSKRLLLNDRGRMLLPMAREVLRNTKAIEQTLRDATKEPIGELRIGASTTIGNYILPWILSEFACLYPKAKPYLVVGNTQQVETGVDTGDLDLGLVEGPYHLTSLTSTFWREDELVVIAGCNHAWSHEEKISNQDLANAPWIMREKGSGTREVFEAAMAKRGIKISISLELGHTEAIKKAVEAGLGVGCLSRMAVKREIENNWLVEINSSLDLRRNLIILTREHNYRTKLLEAYLSFLLKDS